MIFLAVPSLKKRKETFLDVHKNSYVFNLQSLLMEDSYLLVSVSHSGKYESSMKLVLSIYQTHILWTHKGASQSFNYYIN